MDGMSAGRGGYLLSGKTLTAEHRKAVSDGLRARQAVTLMGTIGIEGRM